MAFLSSGGVLSSAACSLLALCGSSVGVVGVSGEGPVGTWGGPRPSQPEMVIEADGSIPYTDGLDDAAIAFVNFITVDTWLSDAWTAVAEERTMHYFDAEGHEIGALPRR